MKSTSKKCHHGYLTRVKESKLVATAALKPCPQYAYLTKRMCVVAISCPRDKIERKKTKTGCGSSSVWSAA